MTTIDETSEHLLDTADEFVNTDEDFGEALKGFDTADDDFFPNSPKRIEDTADDAPILTSRPVSINANSNTPCPDDSNEDRDQPPETTPEPPTEAIVGHSPEPSNNDHSTEPLLQEAVNTIPLLIDPQPRLVEKLRICIPSTSPGNYSSSSSESGSSRHKKRHCITCDIHFRHKSDLLKHLCTHVSQPSIQLQPLDPATNHYYREYLRRQNKVPILSVRKDLNSEPTGGLKLKLKINQFGASTSKLEPEVDIRILSPGQIKQSPEHKETPLDAMVALTEMTFESNGADGSSDPNFMRVAEPDRVHFECPTLDGLDQFNSDESDAAQMLKRLLENPQEPTDSEWAGASSNEFMSIDKLMHICTVCHSNFADAVLLYEHKRITGHEFPQTNPSVVHHQHPQPHPSNQPHHQPMHMQQNGQYGPGPPRHNMYPPQHPTMMMYRPPMIRPRPPIAPGQHPPSSYGQPGVVPLSQMQQQIRTFNMHQQARFGVPIRPPYNHPTAPPQQQQHPQPPRRTPPPLYRVPNNQNGPNGQPLNMAPFMGMNPEMYNPVPGANVAHPPNGPPTGDPNNPQRMLQPRVSPLQRMQQHPMFQQPTGQAHSPGTQPNAQQHPQMMRPQHLGPRDPRMPFYPPNNMKRPMAPGMQTRFRISPHSPQSGPSPPNVTVMGRAIPPSNLVKRPKVDDSDDCTLIAMAPPSEGLPIIKSVQGAASIKSNSPSSTIHHQLSDQITLSVKPKDPNTSLSPATQKNPKDVADILANRGITVTPTAKSSERARENPSPAGSSASNSEETRASPAASNSSMATSTEDAVQKIQLNSSVSIISKKRPAPSAAPTSTIDLSNDDDDKPPPPQRPFLPCQSKDCTERFVTQEGLARHMQRVHRMTLRLIRCKLCPAKFSNTESLAIHHRKTHRLQKVAPDELGLPVVDLGNEETRKKLAALGIVNYIPLGNLNQVTGGAFGLPIVSVAGSTNSSIFNMAAVGADSLLSLGPIKQIPKRIGVEPGARPQLPMHPGRPMLTARPMPPRNMIGQPQQRPAMMLHRQPHPQSKVPPPQQQQPRR